MPATLTRQALKFYIGIPKFIGPFRYPYFFKVLAYVFFHSIFVPSMESMGPL